MNFKIFFLFISIGLSTVLVSAQSNRALLTAVPSAFPDTINKPAIVVDTGHPKTTNPETNVRHQTTTVSLETTFSIGKASAVTEREKHNSMPDHEKSPVKYFEQKVEKQEAPDGTSTLVTPK